MIGIGNCADADLSFWDACNVTYCFQFKILIKVRVIDWFKRYEGLYQWTFNLLLSYTDKIMLILYLYGTHIGKMRFYDSTLFTQEINR